MRARIVLHVAFFRTDRGHRDAMSSSLKEKRNMKMAPKMASNIEVILDVILQIIAVITELFELIGLPLPLFGK